ncbi:MAG TPA: tetratricopeptide repeat protein [Silvibacterium sp.]|nr:tetratricopeptide repeat protein [Silvibacterium sp.]
MFRVATLLLLAIALPGFALAAGQSSASSINAPGATDSVSQLEEAKKALAAGHSEDALKQLDILAAITPEPQGVERLRGFAYYQEKNMAAAEAAFARAVAQDPADRESMQMRGVTLYSLGRPADAIPLLEQAHVAVPSANVDPNYVLGVCYIAVRRYDDARRAFAAQYGFSPDSAPAYLLAARLLRQENHALAEEFAHKALTLQPDLPLAHLLLGEIALARAQFPEAIAEFNRERELSPLDGIVYEWLGDAYLRSGNDEKAQDALTRAVLLEPKASGPYVLLGKVTLDQRNYLLASIYLEHALSTDPGNSMAHALLAQAYRGAGRIADADKQSEAAAQLQNGRGAGGAKLQSVH